MLTPEEIEKIKELSEKGYKVSQISSELGGISRSTIKNYLLGSESPENMEPSQRTKRSRFSRPPILDPSPQLKIKREQAEAAGLDVDVAKGERELQKIKGGGEDGAGLKSKENEVKLSKLDAEQIKIKNEIKRLKKEEIEEMERESRKGLLEKVKLNVVPLFLRNELPSSLLAITLAEITKVLVPLINLGETSEEELRIYGRIVREKIFLDPNYSKIIQSAIQQMVRDALEKYLKECIQLFEEEAPLEEIVHEFQIMNRDIAEG
jgi:hypothetical protein